VDTDIFHLRGPILDHAAPHYVNRAEDDWLLRYVNKRKYVTLLGPRQTGKTSLLLKLQALASTQFVPALVDLWAYKEQTEPLWYRSLARHISKVIGDPRLPPEDMDAVVDHIAFRDYLRALVRDLGKPLLLLMDEIGTVPQGTADRFFGVVRELSSKLTPEDDRCVFVLAGATDPNKLISRDNPNSPLNTTYPLYTQPLTQVQFQTLIGNLARANIDLEESCSTLLFGYTGGHVNLAQKACNQAVEAGVAYWTKTQAGEALEKFVRSGDENLRHIREELATAPDVRDLALEVLRGRRHRFDRTDPIVAQAELLGIVRDEAGSCTISNRIYQQFLEYNLTDPELVPDRIEVFYSYSHKDEKLRDELDRHLAMLKRENVISGWHDRRIGPGHEWAGKIDERLKRAALILLLVTADFLASDYCYDIEMKLALERHAAKEACVIPVILKPSEWERAPFYHLQVLPKDGRPVTKWPNRAEGFVNVVTGIRTAVEELKKTKSETRMPN
jgi:hypothetical protein